MAITQGHGNPAWTREETILALDLYNRMRGRLPSKSHPDVQELSTLLRSLPYHADAAKNDRFRNVDGVVFKLGNLKQVATGRGLSNTSSMDRSIWSEFGERPQEVAALARSIAAAIPTTAITDPIGPLEEFREGRLLTIVHMRRERNPKARAALFEDRRAKGHLHCEICGLTGTGLDPDIADALFEAHHLLPLYDGVERKTRLRDLALLCACCHRLIHRTMTKHKQWVGLDEAQRLFAYR